VGAPPTPMKNHGMTIVIACLFSGAAIAQSVLSATSEGTSDGGSKVTVTFLGPPPVNSLAAVIRGAPYSAEQISERARILADGTKVVEKTPIVQMFRDSAGRRRIDSTQPGLKGEAGVELIEIRDYVANLEYTLDVANHVAHRMKFITEPTSKTANVLPHDRFVPEQGLAASVRGEPPFRQSLGYRTIEGLVCEGTRETSTIPSGAEGNDKPIVISTDIWNSRVLGIRVESTSKDPRIGETVTRMTHIRREEPSAALFQVPADYLVKDETGRFAIELVRPAIREDERPVRALIKTFADARNAHDGPAAAATYAVEGEYRAFDRPAIHGSAELGALWGRMTGQMSRSVSSVHFVAPNLAIAVSEERFVGPEGESQGREAFTVANIRGEWRILIHQQ
jgi:hypothetical protein